MISVAVVVQKVGARSTDVFNTLDRVSRSVRCGDGLYRLVALSGDPAGSGLLEYP
jgi:hypothetical protein